MWWTRFGGFEPAHDPFLDIRRVQEQLSKLWEAAGYEEGALNPPLNMWADGDTVKVSFEASGFRPEQFEITVLRDALTVKASREEETRAEGERMLRRERGQGGFVRSVELPFAVDADKVDAKYKHGVLTITLPRAEADKPRRISLSH